MQSVRSDKSDGVNPPIYYVVVGGANQVRHRTNNSQNESLLGRETNQLSVRVRAYVMRVMCVHMRVGSRACERVMCVMPMGGCICASARQHTSLVHNPPMFAPYVKATDCITVVVLL